MRTFTDSTLAELTKQGVGFERIATPWIKAKHIDGPMLHFSDHQCHWLTIWERIQFRFGWTDARKLQRKLRPRLTAELESHY